MIEVPDSYIVEVDGHRYRHNKHDLTLHKPGEEDDSNSHSDTHDEPMVTGVMPTLCPRPQLKFLGFLFKQLNRKTAVSSVNVLYIS